MYNCPRCGYTTHLMCNMKNHLSRKKVCKNKLSNDSIEDIKIKLFPIKNKPYACDICGNTYKHLSSKIFHEKHCTHNQIQKLHDQVQKLSKELSSLKNKKQSNIRIQNNYSNCNITTINAYGSENKSITFSDMHTYLLQGAKRAIMSLVKDTHFNPQKPENTNFYISNYKDNIGRVFDGQYWTMKHAEELVDEVFDRYRDMIEDMIEEIMIYSDDETIDQQKKLLYDKLDKLIEKWNDKMDKTGFEDNLKSELKNYIYGKKDYVRKLHNLQ